MEVETSEQPIAGPSRLSPPPSIPQPPLNDVEMEDQAMSDSLKALAQSQVEEPSEVPLGPGSQSQEAAELLLGFSSLEPRVDDVPTLEPPSPGIPHTGLEPPRLPSDVQSGGMYPYTPPDEPRANGDTPSISTSLPYTSLNAYDPPHPSSPVTATSPEAGPSKPKQKRKRPAASSASRRTSTDPARPPHFMGEDNEIIRCICGIDEDDGLTIQCESCYAWQHAQCFGYRDAESAPEIYYCELCSPREYNPSRAREVQVEARNKRERERSNGNIPQGLQSAITPFGAIPGSGPGGEKVKSRGKGKRARMGSVHEGDGVDRGEKDASPGTMAPPTAKPRRKPGPKPKPKPTSTTPLESTPAPSYYPPTQSSATTEAEDDYFRIEPWTLEYTPVRDNIVRGREARRIMGQMYREWVDAEEDEDVLSAAKRRSVSGPSGLPSPTDTGLLRFTPDNLFPSPDFSTLAPPVPPASLLGPDLLSISQPISVKPISHSLSFLPISYSDATPLAGPYTRPALYGVFASDPISASSFIGEFRAEVIDCESYRKDPVNQYPILGITKPLVHPVGPPVNLMLDSRGYGCELRFIRPGCHPNVVLRPLLFRTSESEQPKLRFGIFASEDIPKNEELVLAWSWDDSHIVHALRSLIHPTVLADGYPGRPSFAPSLPSDSSVVQSLLDKFEVVLTHLLGTFSSCACKSLGNCAIAQMRYLVEQREEEQSRAGRRGQRADVGRLVGAVRGWRRREEEIEGMKKWNLPEGIEGGWGRQDHGDEDINTGEVEVEEAMSEPENEDVEMDEEEEADEGEAETPTHQSPLPTSPSVLTVPSPSPSRQSSRSESPLTASPRPATPPMARPAVVPPSSALSSAPRPRPPPPPSDDGHLSDATTATVPRSLSSEDEDEAEVESEAEDPRAKATAGRKRRVLSPVVENKMPSPEPEPKEKPRRIRKDGKEDKRFKSRDLGNATGSNKRQRNRIVSSPGTEDESMDLPGRRRAETEDMAASLFPEESQDVKMDEPEPQPEPVVEPEVQMEAERVPTPPVEPIRLPTPPPPEPPKKVSLADFLKNRKFTKKGPTEVEGQTTPLAHGDEGPNVIPETTFSVISTINFPTAEEAKPDVSTQPEQQTGFNMLDFLPSSRPLPSSTSTSTGFGTSQVFESPRATPGSTSYAPRSEYFPITSATPAATAFQPRNSTSYTPRPSASTESEGPPPSQSYTPRAAASPMDEIKPLPVVDDLPNGYNRYNGTSRSVSRGLDDQLPITSTPAYRPRQRSASDSPVKNGINLPETSMPPPLPYREPPPHQSQAQTQHRQYASASLSPETRTSGLPPFRSPIDHNSPLPRVIPTGPKSAQSVIPPTGPRGVWQTPTSGNTSTPTSGGSGGIGYAGAAGTPGTPSAVPAAPSGPRGPMGPIPVPGLGGRGGAGGFGGNMRFFEPRGTWRGRGMGRGHHIGRGR